MSNNQPVEAFAQIDQAVRKEIDGNINRAFDDIFEVDAKNPIFPEHHFKHSFLPFFSGQVKDDREKNITTEWIGIAGSPMNAVDVVNGKGEVVFTIPPLWHSGFLDNNSTLRGTDFSKIFKHAREQAQRLPHLAEQVIGTYGKEKMATLKPTVNDEHRQQLNKMLDFYGIAREPDKVSADGKSVTKSASNGSDDLVFD